MSTSHSTLKAIDEESNNLPHIYYIDNSQNLTQKASESQCVDASGIKLVNCIFSHNPASQCEAFSKLPVFKKREFLRELDIIHYLKFLAAYNEKEWKNLFDGLSDYEKSHWPKTVKEQIEAIAGIKLQAEKTSDAISFGGKFVLDMINPALFLGALSYEIYHIIRYDEHPVKANFLKAKFKNYMQTTFEI